MMLPVQSGVVPESLDQNSPTDSEKYPEASSQSEPPLALQNPGPAPLIDPTKSEGSPAVAS